MRPKVSMVKKIPAKKGDLSWKQLGSHFSLGIYSQFQNLELLVVLFRSQNVSGVKSGFEV